MRVERPAGRFGEDDDCYTFENFKPERKLPLLLVAVEPDTKNNKSCFNKASSKKNLMEYKRKLLLFQIRATGRRRLRQYHHPQPSIRSCGDTRQKGQICVSSAKSEERMVCQESLRIYNRAPDICASSESPRRDDVRNDENGYSYILKNSLDNDCEGANAQNRSSLQNYTLTSTRKEQKQKYPTSAHSDGFDRLTNGASELLETPVDIQIGYRYKLDLNSPSSTTCGDIYPLSDEKIDHHQESLNKENRHNKRTSLSSTAQSFTKWSDVTSSTRPSSTSAFASDGSTALSTSTTSEGRRKGVRVFESIFCRSSKLEAKNEWFVNPSQNMGATKQTMVMDVFDGTSNRINKYKVVYNA